MGLQLSDLPLTQCFLALRRHSTEELMDGRSMGNNELFLSMPCIVSALIRRFKCVSGSFDCILMCSFTQKYILKQKKIKIL